MPKSVSKLQPTNSTTLHQAMSTIYNLYKLKSIFFSMTQKILVNTQITGSIQSSKYSHLTTERLHPQCFSHKMAISINQSIFLLSVPNSSAHLILHILLTTNMSHTRQVQINRWHIYIQVKKKKASG